MLVNMGANEVANQMVGIFDSEAANYNQYGIDWNIVYESMSKIFGVGGMVIQFIAILIAILFTLTVCLELLYITLPLVRDNLESLGERKTNIKIVYKVTLGDARKAVEIANTVKTGRQPIQIYLALKLKQFIIVAVQLWVAFNISDFVNLLLEIAGPITDTFKKFITS